MEALKTGLIDWAVAGSVLPGETASGDLHLVRPLPEGALIAVVDGLGHGLEAAEAARTAIGSLERDGARSVISLVRRCHEQLAGTRGVVMSVAAFNAREGTLTWTGVGNVEGVLLRAHAAVNPRRESLLLRGGVVGVHLPALSAAIIPLTRGDTLIFATDGIESAFALGPLPGDYPPQPLADHILARWGRRTDDALALVARWVGSER